MDFSRSIRVRTSAINDADSPVGKAPATTPFSESTANDAPAPTPSTTVTRAPSRRSAISWEQAANTSPVSWRSLTTVR